MDLEVTTTTSIVDGYTVVCEKRTDSLDVFITNNATNKTVIRHFNKPSYSTEKYFSTIKEIQFSNLSVLNSTYIFFPCNISLPDEIKKYIDENDICRKYFKSFKNKKNYSSALKFISTECDPIEGMKNHFVKSTIVVYDNWHMHPILCKLKKIIKTMEILVTTYSEREQSRLNKIILNVNNRIALISTIQQTAQFNTLVKQIIYDELEQTNIWFDSVRIQDLQLCFDEPIVMKMSEFANDLNIAEFIATKLPPTKCVLGKYEKLFSSNELKTVQVELLKISPLFTDENVRRVFLNENVIDFTIADTPAKKHVTDELDRKLSEVEFLQK